MNQHAGIGGHIPPVSDFILSRSRRELHQVRIFPLTILQSNAENVINQGLFYLDWLLDHKANFQLLVQKRLSHEVAEAIDWIGPRLLCIAGDITKYDE